mmetsp:Transcript_76829/g.169700  ORF Transcript_76829/g.169700 Transcript_76829/m.169700 type:complete len:213 (+) Transcript_76829:629-1267(+)
MLPLEILEGILGLHSLDLSSKSLGQAFKDVIEQTVQNIQDLMVVILERHLYVKPSELGHMSVSEGLLRSKDRAHLKDSRHIGHQGHLFVQLRTLCQVGIALKIVHAEHIRTSLRCATDELGSVDLLEIVLQQKLPEEHAHSRLETKDGLVRHRSQVDDAVVQADVLTHRGQRWIFLQLRLTSGCVCQAQWQGLRPANAEDLLNRKFHVLHRA